MYGEEEEERMIIQEYILWWHMNEKTIMRKKIMIQEAKRW